MLDRLLSFFGYGGYLSSSPFGGGGDSPSSPGEAAFSFTPGRKAADTLDASQDERRERITDDDILWPGKTTTIGVRNDEATVFRYTLTLTDLPPSLYAVLPAQGGQWQPTGGVLLQPGEEASFDICFAPPPLDYRTRSQTFSFVITRFDPRRSGDPGVILGDLAARWIGLAEADQVQISARPAEVVTRPWRPAARFDLAVLNASLLPPTVTLRVLRAASRDGLTQNPEPAGTLEQALEARTGGVWRCLLPPSDPRTSYFATVVGSVRVADTVERRLNLRQPISVRHIPWLRRGRDWAFLFGSALLLLWLIAGLPAWKTPIVAVPVQFSGLGGALPEDASLKDMDATLTPTDAHGEPSGPPLPGEVAGKRLEFTLPTRVYWVRWPFGPHIVWNGFSRTPQHFLLDVKPKSGREYLFRDYNIADAAPPDGLTPAVSVAAAPDVLGPWTTEIPMVVPRNKAVLLDVSIGHLGALSHRDPQQITLSYALQGQDPVAHTYPLVHDPTTGGLMPIQLDLTKSVDLGTEPYVTVQGQIGPVRSDTDAPVQVRHREAPYRMVLTFPDVLPAAPPGGTGPAAGGPSNTAPSDPVPVTIHETPPGPGPTQPSGGVTPPTVGTTPAATGGTALAAHQAALQRQQAAHQATLQRQAAQHQAHLQRLKEKQAASQQKSQQAAQQQAAQEQQRQAGLRPRALVSLIADAASESQINLYWVPTPNADTYSVYRSPFQANQPPNWVLIDTVSHINYADKSVARGKTYQYQVVCNNDHGSSGPSETATATSKNR